MSDRLSHMRAIFGADYQADETKYEERSAWGATPLSTSAWRELVPFAANNVHPKLLLVLDSTVNLKAASSDAADTNTAGTGARTLAAVYLDSSFVEQVVAGDVLLNGTTEAAVNASSFGLVGARVATVGSGAQQAGSIGFAITGDFVGGVPSANFYGNIPLEPFLAPVPLLGLPAGQTSGLVVPVPASRVGAFLRLTVASEGPALLQITVHRVTGPYQLQPIAVREGEHVYEFDAPPWIDVNGAAAGIPAVSWISASAISRGSANQWISARLDWVLLSTA